jgi:hypothetical protein
MISDQAVFNSRRNAADRIAPTSGPDSTVIVMIQVKVMARREATSGGMSFGDADMHKIDYAPGGLSRRARNARLPLQLRAAPSQQEHL